MIFSNSAFLYILPICAVPILIYIFRKFFLPRIQIPSLKYILDDPFKKKIPLDKELLRVFMQTLILLLFLLAFGKPSFTSNPRSILENLPQIAIVNNSFTLSKQPQGHLRPLDVAIKLMDDLGIRRRYYYNELIQGFNLSSTIKRKQYFNGASHVLENFAFFDKKISDLFKGIAQVHYFSPLCTHGLPKNFKKPLNRWIFYPMTDRVGNNAYFKQVRLIYDPLTYKRSLLVGALAYDGKAKIDVSLFIDNKEKGIVHNQNKAFKFPIEISGNFLKGYLKIHGDDLAFDNVYHFVYPLYGRIFINITGENIYTVLGNIFEPLGLKNTGRFKVFGHKTILQKPNLNKPMLTISYGNQDGAAKMGAGFIWLYDSAEPPPIYDTNGKTIMVAQESIKGKRLAGEFSSLRFSSFLGGYKGAAQHILTFSDGTPAAIKTKSGKIYVFFDPLSVQDQGIYSIDFPFLMQQIVFESLSYETLVISNRAEIEYKVGFIPDKFGFYENAKQTYAYNPDPEESGCEFLKKSELARLPGRLDAKNMSNQAFFATTLSSIFLMLSLVILLTYLKLFLKKRKI